MIAWSIAGLVLAINMYLLAVSVLSSIVESVVVISLLGVATVLYVAFVCYLVLEPAQEDGNWMYIKRMYLSHRSEYFFRLRPSYENSLVQTQLQTSS